MRDGFEDDFGSLEVGFFEDFTELRRNLGKLHDATGKTAYQRRAQRAERFRCSSAYSLGTAEKNTTSQEKRK